MLGDEALSVYGWQVYGWHASNLSSSWVTRRRLPLAWGRILGATPVRRSCGPYRRIAAETSEASP